MVGLVFVVMAVEVGEGRRLGMKAEYVLFLLFFEVFLFGVIRPFAELFVVLNDRRYQLLRSELSLHPFDVLGLQLLRLLVHENVLIVPRFLLLVLGPRELSPVFLALPLHHSQFVISDLEQSVEGVVGHLLDGYDDLPPSEGSAVTLGVLLVGEAEDAGVAAVVFEVDVARGVDCKRLCGLLHGKLLLRVNIYLL
jgi:hypothetical protein